MTHAATPPDPATDPVGALELELRVLVRRAAAGAAQTARWVHPELDASAYPLLAHISLHPGIRGSDLATHFGVGRATVSRQLAKLEGLGLIHREVDPEDTRGQRITLTEDGAARLRAARSGRVEALAQALDGWAPGDVAQLATLLRRYSNDWVEWRNAHTDAPAVLAPGVTTA